MRFAVIGPTYPFRGGIAHHTTLLVQALREAGHEVLFLSYTRQYPRWLYPGKDDRDPSQHPLKTEVRYLVDSLNPVTWWRAGREIGRFGADEVIIPYWVPFWAPFCAFMGVYLQSFTRARVTFLVHNALPHEAGRLDGLALRWGLRSADRFVAHAESQAEILRRTFPAIPTQVTPHPTYAPLGAVVGDEPLPLPKEKPILLFCGLIRPYKGLDILLEALPLVVAQWDVHLAIVGEMWGGLEESYREQIARLDIGRYISIENAYVSNERLAAYIQAATAVVLPYRSATQSGIAEMALGLGATVIASQSDILTQQVGSSVNGILFHPLDAVTLSNTILQFLSQKPPHLTKQAPLASNWDQLVEVLS